MSFRVPDLYARIALEVPIADAFDYAVSPEIAASIQPGTWVVVPWGRGQRTGVVLRLTDTAEVPEDKLRDVASTLPDAPTMPDSWVTLARFAAGYYHRTIGEVALPSVPKLLRTPPTARSRGSGFARARKRAPVAESDARGASGAAAVQPHADAGAGDGPPLNAAQQAALDALRGAGGFGVWLLHGITGSGKTEVYLRWLRGVLDADPQSQVLLLVPEIALTPQLARQVQERLAGRALAVLHSDLPDGERAAHWLAAAEGRARVVIGTRLAVLAPIPHLKAIVVDEEHDPSYKQQEGVRYSARDLAIVAASQRGVPIVLGSATPSLESWHAATRGRYRLLSLAERASGTALPVLHIVDVRAKPLDQGLSRDAIDAIRTTLERGERVLVFMNRRGFAPVLNCEACGWLSRCEQCSAFRVLHRLRAGPPARYRLVCHHCSAEQQVPRACPDCGNVDLTPLGRGTQRLEEGLQHLFPDATVARLDRDVARRRGAAQSVLAAAHAGEVDILVGTQMLAKGHDFRGLTLVVVVDADGGLYSSDFRAPERLFATLMQVAGRAGRDTAASRVLVQTRFASHPLFAALSRHDYEGFATLQLQEREQAGLPPFVHQALLRAEAKSLPEALALLGTAREHALQLAGDDGRVSVYDPVPMAMTRIAGIERAQLLVESASRKALHALLDAWLPALRALRSPVRWQLDVDPLEI